MSLADIRNKLRTIENTNVISSKNMMVSVILKDGTKTISNFTDQDKFNEFIKNLKKDPSIQSYHISYVEKMEDKNG